MGGREGGREGGGDKEKEGGREGGRRWEVGREGGREERKRCHAQRTIISRPPTHLNLLSYEEQSCGRLDGYWFSMPFSDPKYCHFSGILWLSSNVESSFP